MKYLEWHQSTRVTSVYKTKITNKMLKCGASQWTINSGRVQRLCHSDSLLKWTLSSEQGFTFFIQSLDCRCKEGTLAMIGITRIKNEGRRVKFEGIRIDCLMLSVGTWIKKDCSPDTWLPGQLRIYLFISLFIGIMVFTYNLMVHNLPRKPWYFSMD